MEIPVLVYLDVVLMHDFWYEPATKGEWTMLFLGIVIGGLAVAVWLGV